MSALRRPAKSEGGAQDAARPEPAEIEEPARASGPAEVMEESRDTGTVRHAIGELISCPFCLDMWVATGFVLGLLFAPRFTRVVAATFTALAGADFLQLIYARAQQAAQG